MGTEPHLPEVAPSQSYATASQLAGSATGFGCRPPRPIRGTESLRRIRPRSPRRAPGRTPSVSGSIEEPPRPEMGELSPLPSMYDLVSHHRAEERRHRHAAMGDSDVVAG